MPAPLIALTDFSTLALCAGSYVDESLAGSQSDLLFSANVSGKPALLYVLFEHQSSADRLMPLRLLRYVVRILERHIEGKPADEALPLPAVIPVVLHHSEGGWSAARRLEDLFDRELIQDAGISELIPRLSFVLDDLSNLTDDELERRALGLLPALSLWALRDARNQARLARSFGHWLGAMAELLRAPNGREALWTIFRYISLVADDSVAVTFSQALDAAQPEVKGALMTLAEKWEAEGKAKGRIETLQKQLTLKFGRLPEAAVSRLATANEAELDRWIERVLTVDTLDSVLNG